MAIFDNSVLIYLTLISKHVLPAFTKFFINSLIVRFCLDALSRTWENKLISGSFSPACINIFSLNVNSTFKAFRFSSYCCLLIYIVKTWNTNFSLSVLLYTSHVLKNFPRFTNRYDPLPEKKHLQIVGNKIWYLYMV